VLRRASVVTALTDGDTLVLDSKTKVRLIGVDTPETVKPNWPVECYGPEASKRLVQLAPKGAVVNAVLDPRNGTKPDRYGRQLLYLYGLDGTFINLQLVREGYGKADPYPNTREHAAEFAAAEKEAQAKGLGLWGHPDTKECRQK
jgi:micrococcal nuclease